MSTTTRVLIVDDDEQIRRMLRRILRARTDLEVVGECGTGEECLERLAELGVDLILMDMQMPGITGAEATRRLKADHPDIRVLALSGNEDERSVAEMIRSGASGYLLKDSEVDEILEAIDAVARGHGALSHEVTPAVLDDVVALYKREQERADALEELDRMKREFMNVVSHELKTPLTSIKGGVVTLLSRWDSLDETLKLDFLMMMEKQTDRLNHLVAQILTVSGIQRGDVAVDEPFDLQEAAREAIEIAEVPAGRRVSLDGDQGIGVSADRGQTVEVIRSLVDNAVRFTAGEVSITARRGPPATLVVADEGPGMTPDVLHRALHQPFSQADASATRSVGGLGLSLYIARQVMAAFGGRLEAESSPDSGSRFTLVFRG